MTMEYFCLPDNQIDEIWKSPNNDMLAAEMFVDHENREITLYFGSSYGEDRDGFTCSFDIFEKSGTGEIPDFTDCEIIDWGQTLRFGKYEAAVDSLFE